MRPTDPVEADATENTNKNEQESRAESAQFNGLQQTHRMKPHLNDFTVLLSRKENQLNNLDRDQLHRYKNRGVLNTVDIRSVKDMISSGKLKQSLASKLVPQAKATPASAVRQTTPLSKISRNTIE